MTCPRPRSWSAAEFCITPRSPDSSTPCHRMGQKWHLEQSAECVGNCLSLTLDARLEFGEGGVCFSRSRASPLCISLPRPHSQPHAIVLLSLLPRRRPAGCRERPVEMAQDGRDVAWGGAGVTCAGTQPGDKRGSSSWFASLSGPGRHEAASRKTSDSVRTPCLSFWDIEM